MIIQLIAPSGYPPDMSAATRGVAFLQAQGHTVRGVDTVLRRYQRFAGQDQVRIDEINAIALLPKDTQLVMAVRGGYGLSRLLPHIDLDGLAVRITQSGLRLVGHSDFTALQLALLAHGAPSVMGPMLGGDFGAALPNQAMLDSFNALPLGQQQHSFLTDAADVIDVSGVLWGGNLTLLCSLLGTPYFPYIDQGILLIEDVNEHPYRIERMLLQLHYAGILTRQKAVVFGEFSEYRLSDYDQGYDLSALLSYIRETLPVPVVTNFPFGHIAHKRSLTLGLRARLSVTERESCLYCA
ncbi:MAG: LD-carboxypeptidase [Ottowia sp.]|nr:LD-carboxypeptidase [Ottowia sp.]